MWTNNAYYHNRINDCWFEASRCVAPFDYCQNILVNECMVYPHLLTAKLCTFPPYIRKPKVPYHASMYLIANILNSTTSSHDHWFFVICFSPLGSHIDPYEISLF